jgi:hypothetical protein
LSLHPFQSGFDLDDVDVGDIRLALLALGPFARG